MLRIAVAVGRKEIKRLELEEEIMRQLFRFQFTTDEAGRGERRYKGNKKQMVEHVAQTPH